MFGLSRRSGLSFSRCRTRSSKAIPASVGSSFARLGVNARLYFASVLGLTGKITKMSCSRSAETIGPWESSRQTAMRRPAKRSRSFWAQSSMALGVFDDRELESVSARDLQADVVLTVGPVDADEGGELGHFFLHGDLLDLGSDRDMQSRAQRRQYGEPVERLSLSVRYGQRHTRGLEAELESVTRSALQIRSPRVHVPLRSSRVASGCPKWNSPPIPPLQQTGASVAQRAPSRTRR